MEFDLQSSLIFALSITIFMVPGCVFVALIRLKGPKILNGIFISYFMMVVPLVVARFTPLTRIEFWILWTLLWLICLGLAFLAASRMEKAQQANVRSISTFFDWQRFNQSPDYLFGLCCGALAMCYGYTVGMYTEIPADVWEHLGRVQHEIFLIQATDSVFGGASNFITIKDIFSEHGRYWYSAVALISAITSDSFYDLLPAFHLSFLFLFFAALFSFHFYILKSAPFKAHVKISLALVSCAIFAATFGKDVFAFSRYYVFAPVFFNYLVFLASLVAIVKIFQGTGKLNENLVIVAIGIAVAGWTHRQEAVFLAIYCLIFSCIFLAREGLKLGIFDRMWNPLTEKYRLQVAIASFLVVLTGVSGAVFLLIDPRDFYAIHPKLVTPLYDGSSLFRINFKEQVLATMGFIGIVTTMWYWTQAWRHPCHLLFIASSVVPLVTVLNPFFVTVFLKMNDSFTVWRFLYMQMTSITLTVLLFNFVTQLRQRRRENIVSLGVGGFFIISLLLVVSFAQNDPATARFSGLRMATIVKIPDANSEKKWTDLIDFLQNYRGSRKILTDPITGYVLKGATDYRVFTRKMMEDPDHSLWRGRYGPASFNEHAGWLLIVNMREGAISANGANSGHWSHDVLQTRSHYPEAFLEWLNRTLVSQELKQPDNGETTLSQVWQQDGITVYRLGVAVEKRLE